MSERIVLWDDFSGGEFGDTPPHQAAANQFTGLNVLVYRNGEIGPRPGITGLANAATWDGDGLYGAGFVGQPANSHWYATMDTTPDVRIRFRNLLSNTWDATRDVVLSIGTDAAHQVLAIETAPDEIFFLIPGQNFFHYEGNLGGIPATTEITDITGTLTPGRALAVYRDRLFVSVGNTVYYSSDTDFESFTIATDFFPVGPGPEVRWMGTVGDELLIMCQDSSIYSYRGVPDRESLRLVYNAGRHPWSMYPGRAFVTPSGQMMFVPVDRDYPAVYNGGRITEFRHLKTLDGIEANDADDVHFVGMDEDDEVFIWFSGGHPDDDATSRRALLYRNGVWTYHRFDPKVNGSAVSTYNYVSSDRQRLIYIHSLVGANGGAGGLDQNRGNTYDMHLERPGFTSDTYAAPGDNSNTPLEAWFKLGEWWADEGYEVEIKNIIVDFTKYRTGQSETSHFDVKATLLSQQEKDGTNTVSFRSFDEANTSASTTGTRDRHITGQQSGGRLSSSGFQIYIDNIRACTIRAIRVVIEVRQTTPRF